MGGGRSNTVSRAGIQKILETGKTVWVTPKCPTSTTEVMVYIDTRGKGNYLVAKFAEVPDGNGNGKKSPTEFIQLPIDSTVLMFKVGNRITWKGAVGRTQQKFSISLVEKTYPSIYIGARQNCLEELSKIKWEKCGDDFPQKY